MSVEIIVRETKSGLEIVSGRRRLDALLALRDEVVVLSPMDACRRRRIPITSSCSVSRQRLRETRKRSPEREGRRLSSGPLLGRDAN